MCPPRTYPPRMFLHEAVVVPCLPSFPFILLLSCLQAKSISSGLSSFVGTSVPSSGTFVTEINAADKAIGDAKTEVRLHSYS